MENENFKSKKNKSSGNNTTLETLAFVIISFVIIFVMILIANGIDPTVEYQVGAGVAANIFFLKMISFWIRYVNPVIIVLNIALLGLLILSIVKSWSYERPYLSFFYKRRAKHQARKPSYKKIALAWRKIITQSKANTPEARRLAIIDADALVDAFLKQVGYEGEHIADRLSQIIPGEMESLEGVWQAHRLRNNLVHASGVVATQAETRKALKNYENFLKELGVL